MNPVDNPTRAPMPRSLRRRVLLLAAGLLSLTLIWLSIQTRPRPTTPQKPPWWTRETIVNRIVGQRVPLPSVSTEESTTSPLEWTVREDDIESLDIEPQGYDPEGDDAPLVHCLIRTDHGRFELHGTVSLYPVDGRRIPIVNEQKGWFVKRK